jgi:cytochrome c553
MRLLLLSIAVSAIGATAPNLAIAAGNPSDGKQKSQVCVACHAEDGNSTNPQFPRLAGQHADYLVKALRDYKSGERKNPIMAPFAMSLSARDMEDLAAYFSRQKGLSTR